MAVHRDPAAHRNPAGRQLTPIGLPDDPALELRRVVSRLTARSGRLERGCSCGGTPADLVRAELQWLAGVAAGAEREPLRRVPTLGVHALADQLTVLVNDLLVADPGQAAVVTARLAQLRRALP